ncbi:MAG: hypothetical protein KA178_12920 [Alphaproteobacteria bacterium]|nr:hypothetical protein [Alphaproteobacteria bacterium]MBP7760147.1 hypothetical protein [Alphaproteobacteria bacterium]MBP7763531.1 hypothetical protein [Alphaproteobacteria bacterium]
MSLEPRCKENKTDFYFNADTNFDVIYGRHSQAEIRYRIDEQKPITEYWSESTDGKAAFSDTAINTLRKMADAESILIEFTPHNASPVTAKFDIHGLRPLLQKIAETCNWKL